MSDIEHWEKRYREGDSPWDSGQPSGELMRVLTSKTVSPQFRDNVRRAYRR